MSIESTKKESPFRPSIDTLRRWQATRALLLSGELMPYPTSSRQRKLIESLGIVLGIADGGAPDLLTAGLLHAKTGEPLFQRATLPEGWKVRPYGKQVNIQRAFVLVDDRGVPRAIITVHHLGFCSFQRLPRFVVKVVNSTRYFVIVQVYDCLRRRGYCQLGIPYKGRKGGADYKRALGEAHNKCRAEFEELLRKAYAYSSSEILPMTRFFYWGELDLIFLWAPFI